MSGHYDLIELGFSMGISEDGRKRLFKNGCKVTFTCPWRGDGEWRLDIKLPNGKTMELPFDKDLVA
jgi:hypothetical protein